MVKSLSKVKGMPVLPKNAPTLLQQQRKILGVIDSEDSIDSAQAAGVRDFSHTTQATKRFSLRTLAMIGLQWLINN